MELEIITGSGSREEVSGALTQRRVAEALLRSDVKVTFPRVSHADGNVCAYLSGPREEITNEVVRGVARLLFGFAEMYDYTQGGVIALRT